MAGFNLPPGVSVSDIPGCGYDDDTLGGKEMSRKRVTRRPAYRDAVYWIAHNDAPGDPDALDIDVVSGYISTCLVADLFGAENLAVAADVVRLRKASPVKEA